MSIFKKIILVASAASLMILSGCKQTETEEIKISELSANIDSDYFSQKAVAKVSNDTASGQDSMVSQIFSSNGTMIYSKNSTTGEQVIVTYAGKTAGTYKTGTTDTDTLVTNLMSYLVEGSSTIKASDVVSAKSNVIYVDATGTSWYSTLCTVTINGQQNGTKLSLINGSFSCTVYKKGDSSQKKTVTGTISNVVGIQ